MGARTIEHNARNARPGIYHASVHLHLSNKFHERSHQSPDENGQKCTTVYNGIRPSTGCVVLLFTDIATIPNKRRCLGARCILAAINGTNKFVGSIRIPFPVPIVIAIVTPALPLPRCHHRHRRRRRHSQTHNLHLIDFVFTKREFAYALLSTLILLLLPPCIEPWSLPAYRKSTFYS